VLIVDVMLEGIEGPCESTVLQQKVILALVTIHEKNIFKRKGVFGFNVSSWILESNKLIIIAIVSEHGSFVGSIQSEQVTFPPFLEPSLDLT